MRWSIIFFLVLAGCITVNPKKIVSPSEFLYYEANKFFEAKDYPKAIEKYKEFIKKSPSSTLIVPAKLNLSMAYYYQKDFKEAYQILKSLNVQDENLKKFLQKLKQQCEKNLEEKAVAKETVRGEKIKITVLDTYLDDYDNIIVRGKVDRKSYVFVNGIKADLKENNIFTASLSWKKGKPLIIVAKDEDGNEGNLKYFPDTEPPEKPTGLRIINLTPNSIELEWDPPIGKRTYKVEDLKGYKLYYRLKGGSLEEIPEIIKDTKYEIVGLQNLTSGSNKTFQFHLRAVDKMNNYSEPSDILKVTLP